MTQAPDPGLEEPGHHHTIYFIFAIFQNPSISFKPYAMGQGEAALFHIAATKLALLILYTSTLWHGGILLGCRPLILSSGSEFAFGAYFC